MTDPLQPIQRLFQNPLSGLWSSSYKYRGRCSSTDKEIREYIHEQPLAQHYAPCPRASLDMLYPIIGDAYSWQLDLMFYGANIFMTCIHTISRYAYAYTLPDKTASSVLLALEAFIETEEPKTITTDNGSEWLSSHTKGLITGYGVTHFVNRVGDHHTLGLIERFHRTLKGLINKCIDLPDTAMVEMEDMVQKVLYNYNHSVHRMIKCTPDAMHRSMQMQMHYMLSLFDRRRVVDDKVDSLFSTGDMVRVFVPPKSENLHQHKDINWSRKIYSVDRRATDL